MYIYTSVVWGRVWGVACGALQCAEACEGLPTAAMLCYSDLCSWALGELFVALGRATLWVRTRRYDADAKDGAARHMAALGGL